MMCTLTLCLKQDTGKGKIGVQPKLIRSEEAIIIPLILMDSTRHRIWSIASPNCNSLSKSVCESEL